MRRLATERRNTLRYCALRLALILFLVEGINRGADRSSACKVFAGCPMNLEALPLAGSPQAEVVWSDVGDDDLGLAPAVDGGCPPVDDGEEKARFVRVVLPHLDEAHALARLLTGNGVDAEDVVQDACLRAFRAILAFNSGNARSWILTIVRHSAYNWLRKNRASTLVLVEDVDLAECAQAAIVRIGARTPEAALIAKTDAARLQAAIATIPAPFRETVVLRELDGLDYREIARVTRVPIGTVMSRLARARRRLVAAMGR
jgi:RNA polymerase sigma factor (sigma-70 family)